MGPAALAQVLRPLTRHTHPALLVGLQTSDDAAVYRLSDEQAIIQTVDFFPPVVDDPFTYGAIAAANSMSDVYAMGGDVLLALNIAAFPSDLPTDLLSAIFEGGASKVTEAGGVIAGGHTVTDDEPKYGLCVTGMIHPQRILTKAGAEPGDLLFLTKPLGTGVITTAGFEDTLRIARLVDSKHDTQRLTGRKTRTNYVKLFLSNTGSRPERVALEERMPVSEVEAVEVKLLQEQTRPAPTKVSEDGIVRFELTAAPHSQQELALAYAVASSSKVAGL